MRNYKKIIKKWVEIDHFVLKSWVMDLSGAKFKKFTLVIRKFTRERGRIRKKYL